MPKKASDKRQPWEVDFIRCDLLKSDFEKFKNWDVKGEVTFDIISRLVDDGFKLSISNDNPHDSVGAWLTSPKTTDGTRQQCMGARGPDMFGALRCLAFKHSVLLDGDWSKRASDEPGLKSWG